MRQGLLRALLLLGVLASTPAMAQITVLDQAQDAQAAPVADPDAPPPPCGTQPLSIASMSWPSAQILAEIHARLLRQAYDCTVQVIPGDLAATGSSMGSTGQPAVAPEMWTTRIAEVWNAGIEAQMVRPAAPTYEDGNLEGWFIPDYLATAQPGMTNAAGLAVELPKLGATKPRFISCPIDWACAVINRNLLTAHGLTELVDVVEPANRFEMDTLIAEAVSKQEPFLFYYWQPNAVLAQFAFSALDMGAFDEAAAQCLAKRDCPTPTPSAFAADSVVTALSEWVFTDIPAIAGYFQRSRLPLAEMNAMLAQLGEPDGTVEVVADRFVAERGDVWVGWLGAGSP
jgi:glycine betaine/proline transport system substrate-binding protein